MFEVLDEALELKPDERAAHVGRAFADDHRKRAAAVAVLAGGEAATFLESPAADFAAPFLRAFPLDSDRPADGARIGSYRILREIGRGGMGTVYLAERADNQYRRLVAVKLLPAWSAGNERLVRRFLDERQILAVLDHPNIARLFDGGVTPDGLPWFAMEYVDGVPIDRYCRERDLPIESRLALFCRVCDAVQYAHRNLVVHRDLKPANILVTPDGGVKLLDFGIAKLLAADAGDALSVTATGERVMTPLYASPEQIRGDPISTASDVYALGVVLSELLTGRYPYRLTTREPHAVARAILEQEPDRPSVTTPPKLARQLRGDLDTIVLKAMEKDPVARYGTADQLEADVRRHLTGLPLAARAESRVSRARKFVRRHRIGVTTTSVVALILVVFGVVATIQAIRIRRQAARIELERDRAEEVSGFLAGLFRTSDPYTGGRGGLTAREILDSGAVRIERELADQPDARAQMLFEMGRAYFGLGVRDRARRFVETSLAIRRRSSPDASTAIASTLDFLGVVLREQGELDAAEQAYRDALRLRVDLLGPRHSQVARILNGLASALRAQGRFRDADSVSRQAVAIDEASLGSNPIELAESLDGLAQAVEERGDFPAAAGLYRRALSLRVQALGATHPEVGRSFVRLAGAIGTTGPKDLADSLFRRGLAIERSALGIDHPDVAADETGHARLLHSRGRDSEAEILYRHALTLARRKLESVHPLTATILFDFGELELDRGRGDRAEPLAREALAMRRSVLPPEHPHIAQAEQLVGAAVLANRHSLEAERYLLPSHDQLQAAYGDDDPRTRTARRRLVSLYEVTHQPTEANRYRMRPERARAVSPPVQTRVGAVKGSAGDVDPTRNHTLPINVIALDPRLADLRDWFHDLMSARLVTTGEMDPGAGHAFVGNISGTSQLVSVEGTMVFGPSDSLRAQARATGPADSLPQLADRLTTKMLALLASQTGEDSVPLAATSLPALRAYLAGRREFRRQRIDESIGHFERAASLDSMLAPARLWLAFLEVMQGSAGAYMRWKLDAAWKQRDRLDPAGRALLIATLGPRYPRAPTLLELVTAGEEATRTAPRWAESWFAAGENLARFRSVAGHPEWESRASAMFRRALELDSTHLLSMDRVVVLAAAAGDRAAVQHYSKLYFARSSEGDESDFARWCAALVLGDIDALARVRARMANLPAITLMRMVIWSERYGVGLEDGVRASDVLLRRAVGGSERRVATQRKITLLLNRGQPDEATRLLGIYELGWGPNQAVGGVSEFQIYASLYWDADSSMAAAAAHRLEAYLRGSHTTGPSVIGDRLTANCALAQWRVRTGDLAGARRAFAAMGQLAGRADAAASIVSPLCAPVVQAQLEAAGGGKVVAADALTRLDSRLRAVSNFRDQMITIGNLTAARLHEARGDRRRALEIIRRQSSWNAYLSTQLREEARLAASQGERAGAIRAYRHYLALRSDAEPRLKPDIDRMRRELAQLEK